MLTMVISGPRAKARAVRPGDAPHPVAAESGADFAHSLVHIIDVNDPERCVLSHWLSAAGIPTRSYAHLGDFLGADRADLPGCLVIAAHTSAISGFEPQAILLGLAVRCPIVVTTSQAGVPVSIMAGGSEAGGIVAKPLDETEFVAAVSAAIDRDREQRFIAAEHAKLRARFATLSERQRQTLALVTRGMLNKQIAGDLGLSVITVKAHRGAAMRKMRARSLADLVRMADIIGEQRLPAARIGGSAQSQSVAAAGRHRDCIPARC